MPSVNINWQSPLLLFHKLFVYLHANYEPINILSMMKQEENKNQTVEQELNDEQLDKATGGNLGKKGLTTT